MGPSPSPSTRRPKAGASLIPGSISYIDGKQTLTITFEGEHSVE